MGSRMVCLECGTLLESRFRHDFQRCPCPNEAFVDGGDSYGRYGAVNPLRLVPARNYPGYQFQTIKLGRESLAPVVPDESVGPLMDSLEQAIGKAVGYARDGYTGIVYAGSKGAPYCDRRVASVDPHDETHISVNADFLIRLFLLESKNALQGQ